MASFDPVRAVLRGLEVLRILNEEGATTATVVASRAQLPQPTVVRLLETLMASGYVYKEEDANLYGVTARTLSLSSGFNANSRLVQIGRPLVEDLRTEIGWPSNLAVFVKADTAMSIVYTNRSAHGMSMPARLGARLPLLVTSVGMAYLSQLDSPERDAVLHGLRRSKNQWDTDPQYWDGMEERLRSARAGGYALAHTAYLKDVYDSKIWSVAVPLIVNGQIGAALSTMVVQSAGSQQRVLKQILPALRHTAVAIVERLEADAAGLPQS